MVPNAVALGSLLMVLDLSEPLGPPSALLALLESSVRPFDRLAGEFIALNL